MHKIDVPEIVRAVADMCVEANLTLPEDIARCCDRAEAQEDCPLALSVLGQMRENRAAALRDRIPLCQDTGMACLFVTLGQEVHVCGDLTDALNEGVRQGYARGYLRKSVVRDPLDRVNTRDNTPAVIHYDVVPGDRLRIEFIPKGFGSENMSRVAMLSPADGREGVTAFVVDAVRRAGPNPCPPVVVGVGIGGTFDYVTYLAKRALLRPADKPHPQAYYAELEAEILTRIQALGIGPQGFGGRTTALAVNIEAYPTHIAGLPCAVNMSCHITRRAEVIL